MHPQEIKAALRIKGITCAVIADDLGVTRSIVSRVINQQTTSQRIAGHVANLLGKRVEDLWPPKRESAVVLCRRGPAKRRAGERRVAA